MDSAADPAVTPWHKRVLDWLGVEPADADDAQRQRLPDPGERFPWEPVPPAPRPPQWGAADRPELLLGLPDGAPETDAPVTVAAPAALPAAAVFMPLPGTSAA